MKCGSGIKEMLPFSEDNSELNTTRIKVAKKTLIFLHVLNNYNLIISLPYSWKSS
jgi:hypothetical protein